jgi:thiamine pyrophosphokinase
MRIVIFANGVMDNVVETTERWVQSDDVTIAANGGTHHARAAGLKLGHVIGDLDSLSSELQAELKAKGTIFHPHPPAKDETDLELALLWASRQEPEQIVILGAWGGRPDQTLANLLLLALPELHNVDVVTVAPPWEIRLIRGGDRLTLTGEPGDSLSLIPLGGDVAGVTTAGLAYALDDAPLYFGPARGVSNIFEEVQAEVSVGEGMLWCFHKRIEKSELSIEH